ncbi:MAG TPA: 1-(5-phosphoribosyl)-5-[(5-phosphoribosylamino)methylideneamino] imidazole-4-carboxamide isomerase, partial [Gemmatimonadaceae bacterium]|nr:1-(5-phosphoribosyl)-5-[(5-phosphoribosylamino)methylideneamino] imidazole-4-carboxamide isomerase [Gemmatimonadaceae bacterium]
GGACVQLAAGSYDQEVIRIPDPVGVAVAWRQYGFRHLHVVDLDGVAGRGTNSTEIQAILGATDAEVQIGGGIRNREAIQQSLADGAHRVIIGTRALEDPDWLIDMSELFPGQIIVAADVRDRKILSHGWTRTQPKLVLDLVEELSGLALAGVLVTAVHREEAMRGTDLPLMEDVVEAADFPVFAGGGLGSLNHLRALADCGVAAAVIGLALYSGAIDPWVAAEEFAD